MAALLRFTFRRVAVLSLLPTLVIGCSVLDGLSESGARASDLPDAGPGGPDSLYAGIGQAIPWGEWGLDIGDLRAPVTGAIIPVSRATVAAALRAAQANRVRLILNLAGAGPNYQNPDGTFNLEMWKARIDA